MLRAVAIAGLCLVSTAAVAEGLWQSLGTHLAN